MRGVGQEVQGGHVDTWRSVVKPFPVRPRHRTAVLVRRLIRPPTNTRRVGATPDLPTEPATDELEDRALDSSPCCANASSSTRRRAKTRVNVHWTRIVEYYNNDRAHLAIKGLTSLSLSAYLSTT